MGLRARTVKRPAEAGAPSGAQVRRAERFALLGAAVFVIGAGLAAGNGHGAVLDAALRLGAWPLVGLVALTLVSLSARTARWHALTRDLGIASGWRDSALCYLAGFAFTLTPGRAGEAVRLWIVRRGHGARYERTASLLIADRVSDALALIVVIAVAAWSFHSHLALAAAASLAVMVLTALLLHASWALAVVDGTYRMVRRGPRLFARLRTLLRQTRRLMAGRAFARSTLLVVVGWLAETAALCWLLRAMGAEVGLLPVAFAFGVAMLVGAVSMLPGGLGGTEATMVLLLMDQGVGMEVALAATVVFRVGTLWFTIALAALALPLALRTTGPAPAAVPAATL